MAEVQLLNYGTLVATPLALDELDRANISGLRLVYRHMSGDWGDLDDHDKEANRNALQHGGRLFSSYVLTTGKKVWIITEADRSATTILCPEEY